MKGSLRNQILLYLDQGELSEKELFEKFRLSLEHYFMVLKATKKQNLISYNESKVPFKFESSYIYPDISIELGLTELGKQYVTRSIKNLNKAIDFTPDKLDYFQFGKSGDILLKHFENIPYSEFKEKHLNLARSSRIDNRVLFYILTGTFIEKEKIKNLTAIQQTLEWLEPYKIAYKYFNEAVDLYDNGKLERKLLDDLRFSLEQFLKEFFKNEKPLEKQGEEIKNYFKNAKVNTHIGGIYKSVFERYYLYQNDSVKHNENFTELEVEFIIELTTSLMKLLLKNKHKNS
ncbi:MAG: hypothetical protein R2750_03205 [Bacteroidales bacterium]